MSKTSHDFVVVCLLCYVQFSRTIIRLVFVSFQFYFLFFSLELVIHTN